MKLHASGEDYLEAVLILQKKNGSVRSIDLARHQFFTDSLIEIGVDPVQAEKDARRIEHKGVTEQLKSEDWLCWLQKMG